VNAPAAAAPRSRPQAPPAPGPPGTGVRLPGYGGKGTPVPQPRPDRPFWRSFTGIRRKRNASSAATAGAPGPDRLVEAS